MEGGRYSAPTDPRGAVGVPSPPFPTRGEGIGLWRAEDIPPLPIRGVRWGLLIFQMTVICCIRAEDHSPFALHAALS